MPMPFVLRSAASFVPDVEGLRRVRATTMADSYLIEVPDDRSEVRLRRRSLGSYSTQTGSRLKSSPPRKSVRSEPSSLIT